MEGIAATCVIIGSNSFVSENYMFQAVGSASSVTFSFSNNSRCVSDQFDSTKVAISIERCQNFTISKADNTSVLGGIYIEDSHAPTITHLPNSEAFVEATEQTLTWQVSDLHPDGYILIIDDEEVESGDWIPGSLEVNIDGLAEGVHEIVMIVLDIDGNDANDTLLVLFISDTTGPIIDSPDDIAIDYGILGRNVIWTPEDEHSSYYEVAMNGSVLTTEDWSGSRIALSLDGLDSGTYNFEITVHDGVGLAASDIVVVTIIPIVGTYTTTTPSIDFAIMLIIGTAAGAIVIVVVVAYFLKRWKIG
ncbi:MAG: hypothetical protein P1Q69_08155 [Candidatus Thorarchaeota archaeon]|nr:hypothetical protein [Candidatus Thorarchaeota archaeon]